MPIYGFDTTHLYVAKKSAQKYKKYDTKFMLCTPWEISPIYEYAQNSKLNISENILAT